MTAAPSRRWAARLPAISAVVLHGLHGRDRIGAARRLAAVSGDGLGDGMRGGRLVELHGAVLGAQRGEVFHEGRRRPDLGEACERGFRRIGELALVDIEVRRALDGE